jgi:hypothetical protein
MIKKLVVPVLVVGLALFGGCGSDSKSGTGGTGGSTGGAGGSTGGAGGATGGAGGATGGAGGATGGSPGDGAAGASGDGAAGASGDGAAGASGDGGADTATAAAFCDGYTGNGMLANKMAADFCKEYETVCTFTGDMRYMNMGDCVAKYNAAVAAGQTCRAGHLCNAKTMGVAAHCPHATGLSVCM